MSDGVIFLELIIGWVVEIDGVIDEVIEWLIDLLIEGVIDC